MMIQLEDARITHPGLSIPDLAAFVPDLQCPLSATAAMCNRVGRDMPCSSTSRGAEVSAAMGKFKSYASTFIKKHFPQITEDDVPSFDQWLDGSGYPGSRKRALRRLWADLKSVVPDHCKNKSFIKSEIYSTFKCPRAINSYTDESKVYLGPLMYAVDHAIFHGTSNGPSETSKFFVKLTNPKTWPSRLAALFGDDPVVMTDFTSFEAHHRAEFAEIGATWIEHVISGLDDNRKNMIRRMVLGVNVCEFKEITFKLDQTLMSGALWTSSLNGVLNLLAMSYLVSRTALGPDADAETLVAWTMRHYRGLHEGDDGICSLVGTCVEKIDQHLINSLGFNLKIDYHKHYAEGSFCGIMSVSGSTDIVCDPIKIMRTFGYFDMKYSTSKKTKLLALLRARAMSYLHLYPNAPIVSALMWKVIQETKGIDERSAVVHDMWKRKQIEVAIEHFKVSEANLPHVPPELRMAVQRSFGNGLLTSERQEIIEEQIYAAKGLNFKLDLSDFAVDSDTDAVDRFYVQTDEFYDEPAMGQNQHIVDICNNGLKSTKKNTLAQRITRAFEKLVVSL